MPPRRRLSPADRRRVILDAAAGVFSEQGYEQASMRTLARAAGVTTPVLYDHFASKQAIYAALLDELSGAIVEHQERVRAVLTEPDPARAMFDSFFAWVEEHRVGWRLLFHDDPADPAAAAALAQARARGTGQIASFLALAPRFASSAALPRETAEALAGASIYAVVNALAAWWWEHPETPRDEIATFAYDVLWRGLGDVTGAGG